MSESGQDRAWNILEVSLMSTKTKIEDENRKFLESLDNDKDHVKIYISGPITNDKDNYERNFKIAEEHIKSREVNGLHIFRPVNPLDLKVDYTNDTKWTAKTWIECMKKDLGLLIYCDAIALCPGWEVSAGCITEAIAAKKLGLLVVSLNKPFGVSPSDEELFPTYQANDTWRKICEIKNTVSGAIVLDKFKRKVDDILDRVRKQAKEQKKIKVVHNYKKILAPFARDKANDRYVDNEKGKTKNDRF